MCIGELFCSVVAVIERGEGGRNQWRCEVVGIDGSLCDLGSFTLCVANNPSLCWPDVLGRGSVVFALL